MLLAKSLNSHLQQVRLGPIPILLPVQMGQQIAMSRELDAVIMNIVYVFEWTLVMVPHESKPHEQHVGIDLEVNASSHNQHMPFLCQHQKIKIKMLKDDVSCISKSCYGFVLFFDLI